jgi:hypothetical protein
MHSDPHVHKSLAHDRETKFLFYFAKRSGGVRDGCLAGCSVA